MSEPAVDLDGLTSEERLELLERVWDSLGQNEKGVPVSEAQRLELDRRLESLDSDVRSGAPLGIPWEEVLQQIRSSR